MSRFRNYWIYSASLAIVWAVILTLAFTVNGWGDPEHILWTFFGFCIGWVSTTIARYVYPPPKRWAASQTQR